MQSLSKSLVGGSETSRRVISKKSDSGDFRLLLRLGSESKNKH